MTPAPVRPDRLRVALTPPKGVLAGEDGSPTLSGLHASLGRELARHLGLRFSAVKYDTAGRLLRGAASREWDVAFLAIDPERASIVEFTRPYAEIENAYLVAATASIRCAADADEAGVRIGVARDTAADFRLSRVLRHALLRRVSSDDAAIGQLACGEVDAVASSRTNLLRFADQMQGYWVLMEPIFEASYGIAVPKGDVALLRGVAAFVERARDSGLVGQEIDRRNLLGVRVASG